MKRSFFAHCRTLLSLAYICLNTILAQTTTIIMALSQFLDLRISFYLGVFACLCAISFYQLRSRGVPKGLRRPPGPKGLPLVGNTLQLGPQPQKILKEWADKYGEIMQVQIGWENRVYLNSPAAVKEIIDKQSAVTSSRPPMPVGNDIISGGMRFLLMGYTPTWRKLRAIVHKLLTPKVSDLYRPSQEFESKQLLFDLLTENENQEDFYMHIRRYSTSVVLTSTYGRRVPKWVCVPFSLNGRSLTKSGL